MIFSRRNADNLLQIYHLPSTCGNRRAVLGEKVRPTIGVRPTEEIGDCGERYSEAACLAAIMACC